MYATSNASSIVSNCNPATASVNLDVNNVRALLLNGGDMFWNLFTNQTNAYEIPKNSGKHSSFTGAIWMSALDAGGNLFTAAQTYRQLGVDFWPGPLDAVGRTNSPICKEWDKMFSVYGSEINEVINGKGVSYNISKWPSNYAPFYDKNSDGIYDPSIGDYPVLDVNKPNTIPGQMVFWMFNDAGNIHTNFINNIPMQVEIHATAYAFLSGNSDAINNSTIYKYKIFNKSLFTYFDYVVGKYIDQDIGYAGDDYSGCDVSRELFYTYNKSNFDQIYGTNPPAIGIQILNSDKNDDGNKLGIGSFIVHRYVPAPGIPNGWDREPIRVYRYMRGMWDDNTFLAYGTVNGVGTTNPCKFMFPEYTDPNGRPYWVETMSTEWDRKITINTNSKTLLPGAVTHFEYAMVWARDTQSTRLMSVDKLKRTADTVLNAYQANFNSFSTGIQAQKPRLSIYPNPTANYLYLNGLIEKTPIKIYNQEAKVVTQKIIYVDEHIDVSDLPAGVYYLQAGEFVYRFVRLPY
jgi:hypothetical protein